MKRKVYQEPTTTVVKVQHRTQLLALSDDGVDAKRSGYGEANDGTENSKGIWIWD